MSASFQSSSYFATQSTSSSSLPPPAPTTTTSSSSSSASLSSVPSTSSAAASASLGSFHPYPPPSYHHHHSSISSSSPSSSHLPASSRIRLDRYNNSGIGIGGSNANGPSSSGTLGGSSINSIGIGSGLGGGGGGGIGSASGGGGGSGAGGAGGGGSGVGGGGSGSSAIGGAGYPNASSVHFGYDPEDATGKNKRKTLSPLRVWNQMTRLQKSIVSLILLSTCLMFTTILPFGKSQTVALEHPFRDDSIALNAPGNATQHLLDKLHLQVAQAKTKEQLAKLRDEIVRLEAEKIKLERIANSQKRRGQQQQQQQHHQQQQQRQQQQQEEEEVEQQKNDPAPAAAPRQNKDEYLPDEVLDGLNEEIRQREQERIVEEARRSQRNAAKEPQGEANMDIIGKDRKRDMGMILDSIEKHQAKKLDEESQREYAGRIQFEDNSKKLLDNLAKKIHPSNDKAVEFNTNFNARQEAVIQMFKWAWKGYKRCAWGKDELLPISCNSHTWFDLGLTLVDALDTMWLMNLKDDFQEARVWVRDNLQFEGHNQDVNLFETTIRVLGGLLTAYHFSGDDMFKTKAIQLGDKLLLAFQTPSGIPLSDVHLRERRAHGPQWSSDSSTAEVTTIQLEFRYLSYLTGDPKYANAANKVMEVMEKIEPYDGLVPIYINPHAGRFSGNHITLGARGDSYYEYLLKQWLQGGKTEARLKRMYDKSMKGVFEKLLRYTPNEKLLYVGELEGGMSFSPKMDHLVCFLPGVLALGHRHGFPDNHLSSAKELLYTCWQMYERMPCGLAPEIAFFDGPANDEIRVKDFDSHNLMRPETVESLFVLYRLTKDEKYREWGWKIFQAFEKHSKIENGGYTSLDSVKSVPPPKRDKMESFFLGETVKYLFLLFSDDDDLVNLDKYVFNTEAHPLPIFEH